MLPKGWKKKPLSSLLSSPVRNGYSPNCPDSPTGKWVLALNAAGEHGFNPTAIKPAPLNDKNVDKFMLEAGDFLVSRSNTSERVGLSALFRGEVQNCSYPDLLMRFRVKDDLVCPEYLEKFLQTYLVRTYFRRCASGTSSSMVKITGRVLEKLPVLLPPLPEQKKIAEILSCWDSAIETIEKLIDAKMRFKKGLMQRLLFGLSRFPDFVKSPVNNLHTSYGYLPSDWRYVQIHEIAKESSLRNKTSKDLTVLSCTKYDGLVDSLSYFGKRIFSEDLTNYRVVRRNEFAYATNHIEEGSIGYQNSYDEALISPIYTVFKASKEVDDRFLLYVLKSDLYLHIFRVNTSASVDRRGSLRWKDFSNLRVPLPSIEEQGAIADAIGCCDHEITTLRNYLSNIQSEKKGLMQQLLTGKTRVNMEKPHLKEEAVNAHAPHN